MEGGSEIGNRREYVPSLRDRETVATAVALGLPESEIAKLVAPPDGIALESLRRLFRKELALGAARLNLELSLQLYQVAMNPRGRPGLRLKAVITWLELHDPERWGPIKSPTRIRRGSRSPQ